MANKKNKNARLLDRIFGDTKVRHGLKVFKPYELDKLRLTEERGNIYIGCAVRGKRCKAKPEEVIRQLTINKLSQLSDLEFHSFSLIRR